MAQDAFDLAELYQTPVMMNTDLDLGMNNWMADPFTYPEKPQVRGKVLTAEDLNRLGGFARYRDVDGDGIPYRTLPGTNHPAAGYFTRGTGHNDAAAYSEREDDFISNMDRLTRKFEGLPNHLPPDEVAINPRARVGLLCCGTSRYAMDESQDQLAQEKGLETSRIRVLAFPFGAAVEEFIDRHDRVYVIDQNRDGQLLGLLKLRLSVERVAKLRSVRYYGGLPLDARTVTDSIAAQEGL